MKQLDLKTVPIINDNFILHNNIDEMVLFATIKSKLNTNVWAEGIVIRPIENNSNNERISFKVINPEFLLKNRE